MFQLVQYTVIHFLSDCCSQCPFCAIICCRAGNINSGDTESEKGNRRSDIGLSLGLLAVLDERLLAKLSFIIGNDTQPSP